MSDKRTDPKDIEMGNIEEYMHAKYFRKAETPDKRTETHTCDCGRKETHGDVISRADEREDNPFELPSIFVAEGYDSIEDEDGNMGFGVYVPRDKQIYVAGEVPYEMFVKALFHELAHWVQDVAGHEFSDDEANDFAERVYEAIQNLPSAEPEPINPCTICQEFDCTGCKFRRA